MASVEPSAEQIAILKADGKLNAAFRWAKVSDAVATAIIDVMGCEPEEDMSTAAAVTTEEVETMMTAVTVMADQVGRPLTIAEKARLRIAFTACRIACGIQTPFRSATTVGRQSSSSIVRGTASYCRHH